MKTIIIEIPENRTIKIKKTLNKFKDITIYEEKDDNDLILCKEDILSYNRALNEYKKGYSTGIYEYLKTRNIDV